MEGRTPAPTDSEQLPQYPGFTGTQATFINADQVGWRMSPDSDEEADEEDPERVSGPRRREGPPDERVLAPEDLDFTEDEKVAQIDEGKFVIGTDSRPRVPPEEGEGQQASDTAQDPPTEGEKPGSNQPSETPSPAERRSASDHAEEREPRGASGRPRSGLTGREVKDFITTELRRTESQYAYRIAAKTEDRVSHQQLASDDIGMAFDGLLMWYAQQVGADTSVEEALGILLAKSNIRIRYPTKMLTAYLRDNDLSPDDDIADLLAVIRDAEGLVFPPDVK